MAKDYTLTELSGKNHFKIATTDVQELKGGVRSPEWMIKIDDLLTSSVKGFECYCELFGWYGESSRFTSGNISNQLFTSATLKHSDLVLLLPNGGHGTELEGRMNLGIPLEEVRIVRLGNIKMMKVQLQTLDFTTCWIQSFQQQLDKLVLHISVSSKTNTVFVYDNKGISKGQMVTKVDYSKNTAQ